MTQSGPTGIVTGIVTNRSGNPLSDVAVEWAGLTDAWGDRGPGVRTDGTGRYFMSVGPLSGQGSDERLFLVRATKTGYVASVRQVLLAPAGLRADFTLLREGDRTGRVTGIVTDPTGRPLSDVTVEWAGLAEAWGDRNGATTDSTGHYLMGVGPLGGPGSAEGLFVIRATKAGYLASERQALLDPAGQREDFTLTPGDRK
jgi:hypothetical protein